MSPLALDPGPAAYELGELVREVSGQGAPVPVRTTGRVARPAETV